jgi:hypothetical protein
MRVSLNYKKYKEEETNSRPYFWQFHVFQRAYYWGHGKLGRCVIQLSKFLNHTLATHNQVDSFFENINHNNGKGAFTLTLFEMTITAQDSMSLIVLLRAKKVGHQRHCLDF